MIEGLIALFFANFIGGALSPLFVKLGTQEFPVAFFTSIRFLIATIIFLPFFLKSGQRLNKKSLRTISAYSLFFAINAILYGIGLQFTTALVSQVLYSTVPIFTGIFSYLIIKEKLGVSKIIGATIALIGVSILMYQSIQKADVVSFGTPQGNLIIVVAIISWSLYLVFSKRLTSTHSPTATSFVSYVVTFIVATLMIPFEFMIKPFDPSSVTIIGISSLLGVGIFSSALSFYLIQYGVKKTTPFTASLFFYLAPLFGSLTALPILHEKITPQLVLGGTLILIGVFLASTYEFLMKKG